MVFAFAGDPTITKFFAMYLYFVAFANILTARFSIGKVGSFLL
jgi:hypothetical protein